MTSFKIVLLFSAIFIFTAKANNNLDVIYSKNQEKTINNLDSIRSKKVTFQFEDKTYTGILDIPNNKAIKSLIVLVPGSGKTRVKTGKWNYELRKNFNHLGIATFAYDKSGCGDSEGEFNYNQSVENSSNELLAAIQELRNQKIPGSQNIGLWGISRAGWVCPLAIKSDNKINYWISVSGPNHLDNMHHLLKTNWTIKGNTHEEIETLGKEWLNGFKIQRSGGSYLEYLNATPNLNKDDFIKQLRGEYTEEKFLKFQKYLIENNIAIDKKSGLQIMLNDFEKTLEQINIPVLAILGEKDSQVDWKETINLYKKTIDKNTSLTIKTIPDCNHFIRTCETGGFDENYKELFKKGLGQTCNSYYETINSWLMLNNYWAK
ncbi:alpha/beta hydrolase [Polaribacter vadi]|uniref:alpha/beta hydrolase family protein n=1 Tax=Polaribacter TaxID=52959 RepID=UPI001C08ED5B|nr:MULTISPECIES: alpha/beta hydrolase [Polaribacter]MBU3012327.1 alpha/beta hydrolase [Polaribacter vadi]MDO6742144.1 alpha/beta hydrolase [Polaribacter sp. 1_MG-2023]